MSKERFFKGTFLLTSAGLISRIMGSLSSATESCLPVVPVLFLLRLSLSFFSLDDTGDTDLPQLPEFPLPGFFPAAHPSVCPAPRLMPAPASIYLPDYADKSDVPKVFAELRHSAIL